MNDFRSGVNMKPDSTCGYCHFAGELMEEDGFICINKKSPNYLKHIFLKDRCGEYYRNRQCLMCNKWQGQGKLLMEHNGYPICIECGHKMWEQHWTVEKFLEWFKEREKGGK